MVERFLRYSCTVLSVSFIKFFKSNHVPLSLSLSHYSSVKIARASARNIFFTRCGALVNAEGIHKAHRVYDRKPKLYFEEENNRPFEKNRD